MGVTMSEYAGARVVAGQLIRGYHGAVERFSQGVRRREPDPSYFALFESLNWAVAIDDVVREIWVPGGAKLDWGWREAAGGEQLAKLLNGARYARNLVHHHWADALRLDEGAQYPKRYPRVYFSWIWRSADELPEHPRGDSPYAIRNRAAYERHLADKRAEDILVALDTAFASVGNLLDPPRPTPLSDTSPRGTKEAT